MESFGNLGTKVLSAINVLAAPMGAATGWLSAPMAEGRGLNGAPGFIIERLKGFKIANPIITTEIALGKEDQYHIISNVVSAGIGLGVKTVGDAVGVSAIERMGSALLKFGSSAAINSLIASYVYEAVNNPHGAGGSGGTSTGMVYSSAPQRTFSTSYPTIDVNNPQRLTPVNAGSAPNYMEMMR